MIRAMKKQKETVSWRVREAAGSMLMGGSRKELRPEDR